MESPTGCTKQLISVACRFDAGGGVDAAGGNEAFFLRLEEAPLPLGALGLALDLGKGARYAAADLGDALLAVLGVLLQQGVPADLLLGDGAGETGFPWY